MVKVRHITYTTLLRSFQSRSFNANDGNMNCISYREKHFIARNKANSGNLSEPWPKRFLDEYSDKGVSGQYLRPNIHPIYHRALPAAWTSLAPSDPSVVLAAGRSAFRVADLLQL